MKTYEKQTPFVAGAVERIPSVIRKAGLQALSALMGFFMAGASIFDGYAPFGVALTAAVGPAYTLPAAVGAAIGAFFSDSQVPLRYIAALIAAGMISIGTRQLSKLKDMGFLPPLNAFLCCTVTGVALGIAQGMTVAAGIMYVSEGLLSAGAAYFMNRAFRLGGVNRGVRSLSVQELSCVVITGCLLLMSLSVIQFSGIAPARVAAVFLILIAARYGRESAGAVVGTAAGITFSLATGMSHLAGGYAFGGLLAGLFSPLGQLGSAAAFAVSNGVVAIMQNGSPEAMATLYEAAIATVLFVAMPRGWGNKIDDYFAISADLPTTNTLRQSVVMRLRFASGALGEVSESVEAVTYKLKKIAAPNIQGVYTKVQECVCDKCGLRAQCWEEEFNSTMNVFNDLRLVLAKDELLTQKHVPSFFVTRCGKLGDLLDCYNHSYMDYLAQESATARVAEVREIVADQFYGMADMLFDLADEFEEAAVFDVETAQRVQGVMREFAIVPHDVSCLLDKFGRMTIEVHCPEITGSVNLHRMSQRMREATDRVLERPTITVAGEETLLAFCERATLHLSTGVCQYASGGGVLCGDSVEIVNDGRGREILIISDGMGSGGRAAVDGAMAAGLLAKLVKAGFGFDCSLRVVNSALLVKSGDESLATLDIACIDLFSGKTDFLKAGAPVSFLKRGKKVGRVELSSLPAGILREVEFARSSINLSPGDIIVLVSDGVVQGSADWITAELESWNKGTAKELAQRIAKGAKERQPEAHEDDLTVIAALVENGL